MSRSVDEHFGYSGGPPVRQDVIDAMIYRTNKTLQVEEEYRY
jgi:hypothetical protein